MSRLPRKDWKARQAIWDAVAALGDGKRCYKLSDKTVAMLLSQTEPLYWHTRWSRDEPFTADEKRQIRQWAAQAEFELMSPADCAEPVTNCVAYPLNSSFLEWLPNDPYTEPNLIPPGYGFPPWYIANSTTLGTAPGDVTTDIARISITPPVSGYPHLRINLEGAGTVQIRMVNLVGGGFAQVTTDDDLFSVQFVDLNRDLISIPVESSIDVIVEIEVVGDGHHHIDVIMIPRVNDEVIPPATFGGAIRGINLCGFTVTPKPCPDCPDPEPCEECEDCEDFIEDEIGLDLEELEMLLDCYKHSTGDIKMAATTSAGASWLLCDGAMHSKAQYPDLYAILAGKTSEDTDNFAVPDFTLKSPMGVGEGLDALAAAGEMAHTLTVEEMPEHAHSFGDHTHDVPAHHHSVSDHTHSVGAHNHSVSDHTHSIALHSHSISPSPHTHTPATLTIPAKSSSTPGNQDRLMRSSGGTGTNDDLAISPSSPAGVSMSIGLDGAPVTGSGGSGTTGSSAAFNTGSGGSGNTGDSATLTTTEAGAGDSGTAGGDEAHSILHPVLGVYFFIFAGCAVSEGDCL